MAPELATVDLPIEARATCERCAKGAPRAQISVDRPFDIDLKCCTFHPSHANWLVGRALRRGDDGSDRTRARMATGEGVTPAGITPSDEWIEAYQVKSGNAFGRSPRFRCPYLGEGDLACTVWRDRGSVCRTWHCLFVDGARGARLWRSTQRVLSAVERRLGAWCLERGDPPDEADWGDVDRMSAWFVACAELVDSIRPVDAAALRDARVERRVGTLLEFERRHMPPLPDVLGPSVALFQTEPDGQVRLGTSSRLDSLLVPGTIFELLSRLDGHTAWVDALAATNAVVEPGYTPDFIEHLFRLGLLEQRDPDAPDPEPGMTATAGTYYPATESLT
jgi:hypothetical protein